MKKNIRRWLALALALVLVFSMAVTASAASKLITKNGTTYMLYLNKLWRSDVFISPNTTSVQHTSGNVTPMYWGGSIPFEYDMDADPIPNYYLSDIEQLMAQDNLAYSVGDSSGAYFDDQWYYVEADQPSGTYWLDLRVPCYRAEWGLTEDLTINSRGIETRVVSDGGIFYHVPVKNADYVLEPRKR